MHDQVCETASPGEAPERLSARGSSWGLVTQAPLTHQTPELLTPRGRAGVQHQKHHLYIKTDLSLGIGGTLLKAEFPDASLGSALQT